MFSAGENRVLFRHVEALLAARKPVDMLTVAESLKASGEMDAAGGLTYLQELRAATPSVVNVRRYGEIVRDAFTMRRLLAAVDRAGSLIREANGMDVTAVLDRVQSAVMEVAHARSAGRGELQQIGYYCTQALEDLEDAVRNAGNNGLAGLSTGINALDQVIGGLKPGQLVVVAGRPGMGKTALAMGMALSAAMKSSVATAVFSMEMQGRELAKRFIADLANIHGLRMSHGRVSESEWLTVGQVVPRLHASPIWICEDEALTMTELAAGARRFRRSVASAGLIVVDYFGLMSIENPSNNRAQDLGDIYMRMKALAKELELPILLLAQLNREVEKRGDKRPILSDLRDSGSLEQDADLVVMLYRGHVYSPTQVDESDAEILVRKQRNGPTRELKVRWDGPRTRFMDHADGGME